MHIYEDITTQALIPTIIMNIHLYHHFLCCQLENCIHIDYFTLKM